MGRGDNLVNLDEVRLSFADQEKRALGCLGLALLFENQVNAIAESDF